MTRGVHVACSYTCRQLSYVVGEEVGVGLAGVRTRLVAIGQPFDRLPCLQQSTLRIYRLDF